LGILSGMSALFGSPKYERWQREAIAAAYMRMTAVGLDEGRGANRGRKSRVGQLFEQVDGRVGRT
jgi:hypothetical protein